MSATMPMMPGRLIAIEGTDGAGKSTVIPLLVDRLAGLGVCCEVLREPGGCAVSEKIREIVKDPALTLNDRCEALLFAAARAQLVAERIVPALDAGRWVLVDRFRLSTAAYQGVGRGLGVAQVDALSDFACDGVDADRTLLLTVEARVAAARRGDRGDVDRIERSGDGFLMRVRSAYDELSSGDPRVRRVDANGTPQQTADGCLAALDDLLS